MICCNDVKLQQCDKRGYQTLTFADVIILTDVSEGVGRSARVGTECIPSSSSVVYLDCQRRSRFGHSGVKNHRVHRRHKFIVVFVPV